jgi:hypothetical protein
MTLAVMNMDPVVRSVPEVVAWKLTLLLDVDAVTVLCVKAESP